MKYIWDKLITEDWKETITTKRMIEILAQYPPDSRIYFSIQGTSLQLMSINGCIGENKTRYDKECEDQCAFIHLKPEKL